MLLVARVAQKTEVSRACNLQWRDAGDGGFPRSPFQRTTERANKVVKQVAEAEKYDVILQEAVYINPKHDITDKVIKALNAAAATK